MSDPINPLAPSQPAPSDHPLWQEFHKWALKRLGGQNHVLYWEAFLLGVKLGGLESRPSRPPSYGASSDSDFDAE